MLSPRARPRMYQDHRSLYLTIGNRPVGPEQSGRFCCRHQHEPMPLIEIDRPTRRGPGPDEHAALTAQAQVPDQLATDAASLQARRDVCVTYQVYIAHRLNSHHSLQRSVDVEPPERDARGNFPLQLGERHVWLVPTIGRNDATVGFCCRVDHRQGGEEIGTARVDVHGVARMRKREVDVLDKIAAGAVAAPHLSCGEAEVVRGIFVLVNADVGVIATLFVSGACRGADCDRRVGPDLGPLSTRSGHHARAFSHVACMGLLELFIMRRSARRV